MTHPQPHVPDPSFVTAPACHVRDAKPRPPRRLEYGTPCCGNVYAEPTMDALVARLTDHLRNCMVFRNDITCRTCPAALGSNIRMGDANTTHHLIPQRVGTMRGEPVHEHRCVSCGQKAVHLKSDSAIEAAITLIVDHVKAGAR